MFHVHSRPERFQLSKTSSFLLLSVIFVLLQLLFVFVVFLPPSICSNFEIVCFFPFLCFSYLQWARLVFTSPSLLVFQKCQHSFRLLSSSFFTVAILLKRHYFSYPFFIIFLTFINRTTSPLLQVFLYLFIRCHIGQATLPYTPILFSLFLKTFFFIILKFFSQFLENIFHYSYEILDLCLLLTIQLNFHILSFTFLICNLSFGLPLLLTDIFCPLPVKCSSIYDSFMTLFKNFVSVSPENINSVLSR